MLVRRCSEKAASRWTLSALITLRRKYVFYSIVASIWSAVSTRCRLGAKSSSAFTMARLGRCRFLDGQASIDARTNEERVPGSGDSHAAPPVSQVRQEMAD